MESTEEKEIIQIWDEFADADFWYVSHSGEVQEPGPANAERHERLPTRQKTFERFLQGELDLESFHSKVASETTSHRLWGFSGTSGGMFFNMLLSAVDPDSKSNFSQLLREVLDAPEEGDAAVEKIEQFESRVKEVRSQMEDLQEAPAIGNIPYFISYFWHLQEPDTYPIYYKSMRDAFSDLDIWTQSGDHAIDYVEFWERNEEIRDLLEDYTDQEISLWKIERMFLFWLGKDKIEDFRSRNGNGTDKVHPSQEWQWRALWLKDRYDEARDWDELLEAAEQTSFAIRELTRAIVTDTKGIGTDELTALYELCQSSRAIQVSTKINDVDNLNISTESKQVVRQAIDERVGSVGGFGYDRRVPGEEAAERIRRTFKSIIESNNGGELDDALQELTSLDIGGLQAGTFSPILHYLHPENCPIINSATIVGMKKYFSEDVSRDLKEYLEYCENFRRIRDRYGFRGHFRNLDGFFVWTDQLNEKWDHEWTWALTEEGDTMRDVYAIQPGQTDVRETLWETWQERGFISVGGAHGDLRELSDEEIDRLDDEASWGAGQAWDKILDMDPGDVVVVKRGSNDLWGLGVVKPAPYEYIENGPGYVEKAGERIEAHPHIRWVEWIWTQDEGLPIEEIGVSKQFARDTAYDYSHFEELRYKLNEILQNGVEVFEEVERYSRQFTTADEVPIQKVGGHSKFLGPHQVSSDEIDRDSLLADLHFPNSQELLTRIYSAIESGKHIIFTGPPGTGKTELAENVCRALLNIEEGPFTDYQLTTATADWTTFDTVGGRRPAEEDNRLEFTQGFVLDCFKGSERSVRGETVNAGGRIQQRNDLLIIDELNRADIDKAFGQLFTLLSGQAIRLQFEIENQAVRVVPASKFDGERPEPHEYVVPDSWRIVATMNSYDKTSLYEMSYAFMRRFAFINVPVPNLQIDRAQENPVEFMAEYLSIWFEDAEAEDIDREYLAENDELPDPEDVEGIVDVWSTLTTGDNQRPVGPAIVKDMLKLMTSHNGESHRRLADAVESFVFPQLQGIPNQSQVITDLLDVNSIHGSEDALRKTAEVMLNPNFTTDNGSNASETQI